MRPVYIIMIILWLIVGGLAGVYFWKQNKAPRAAIVHGKTLEEIRISYTAMRDSAETLRLNLAKAYKGAKSAKAKGVVLHRADTLFINIMEKMLIPYWYGTPWEFYGVTECPQQGTIACGYFVNTLMQHAGIKLNRIKMSTCASETMIKALTDKKYIKKCIGKSMDDFASQVRAQGDGLYLTGLDYHTGFLFCKKGELYFIHSTIPGVMRENAFESSMLVSSRYKVTGKISGDENFLKKWLLGEAF